MCSPNVARPFATIRKRPHEGPMALPMAIVAKVVSFRSVKRRIALFRVAGVALCIIPTYCIICNVSKCVLCVRDAVLSRRCQKMSCSFRGKRSTLETSIVIFCGMCSTSNVLRCVSSFLRIALSGLRHRRVQAGNCKGSIKREMSSIRFFWGQSSETRVRSKTRLNRLPCGTTLQSGDSRTVQTNNMKLLAAHPPGTK